MIQFHNMSILFSSDGYKELLVCINNRHFNLFWGGLLCSLSMPNRLLKQLWIGYTLPVLSFFSLFMVQWSVYELE